MADTARLAEVQLEALRVSDCSWHPCQVSLNSSGSLVVHFESLNLEDVIINAEKLFDRLRVRSHALEGDDCQHIEEGDHILAASKSNSKPLFFDAVVQEVCRTRHSKRIICRCTFMIKWMHQEIQDPDSENITAQSSLVMKLSRESIKIHPVVANFLNSMDKTSLSDDTNLDEPYGEYDLDGVIGKQIEEIGNLVDGATREFFEDIIVRVNPDSSKGGSKEVSVSHNKLPLVTKEGKPRRRSNRNRSNTKTEVEDCEPVITSSLKESTENIFAKEELAEKRSPLNPLAARAALASLVSKFPQKLDLSFYEEENDIGLKSKNNAGLTHSAVHNGTRKLNGDVEPRNLDKDMMWEDIKSRRKTTFSAEEVGDTSIRKIVQALKSDKPTQSARPNSNSKKHPLPRVTRPAFTVDETVEKNKKVKISSADQTQERNGGDDPANEKSALNPKRSNSLKQQPSRSSPRLNPVSRTRSQARP